MAPRSTGFVNALTRTEREINRLLDMFPAPVLMCRDGLVSQANEQALECFAAASSSALVGRAVEILIHPAGPAGADGRRSCLIHRLDGTHRAADLVQSGDPAQEAVLVVQDRKAAREDGYPARLAAAIFAATDEAMLITDEREIILSVNPAFERVTGYHAAETVGRTPRMLSSGHHDPAFYAEMWATLHRHGHWHGEIWNRRKSGELYAQRITLSILRDPEGRVINYVAVFNDITDSKREADRMRRLANHDSLTRLPNRVLLHDRLDQALSQAARDGASLAVLFLDLDGFKKVNDSQGHLMGDRVLEAVAERLCGCVRESDTIARLGGDEFVILLPDVKSGADAEKLAEKLLAVLSRPFVFAEGEAAVGASIGIATYPRDGEDGEALLAAADQAMYRAKRKGGRQAALACPD